jgi:hypothetical protein
MKIRRHVGPDDRQQLAIAGQKPNWDKLLLGAGDLAHGAVHGETEGFSPVAPDCDFCCYCYVRKRDCACAGKSRKLALPEAMPDSGFSLSLTPLRFTTKVPSSPVAPLRFVRRH